MARPFARPLLGDIDVATAPGIDFDPDRGRHFIRLSFAVSTAQVEDALSRMTSWFARLPVLKPAKLRS